MQPQASESVQDAPEVQIVHNTKSEPKDVTERQEKAQDEQKETPKPQTWQDNPQKCNQDTQFIAAEPPFDCIDKPVHTASVAQPAARSASISGTKEQWLAASGIPQDQWHYVDMIVSRESGWDPCAYNPGRSDCNASPTSACGLAQSLPCGKQSKYGHWTDPVANLKWQYEYVKGRYGGYAQAVAFWNANKWY